MLASWISVVITFWCSKVGLEFFGKVVWTPLATLPTPDHIMYWKRTFVSRNLLKATSFHQHHGLGRLAFITLCLLIRKKNQGV